MFYDLSSLCWVAAAATTGMAVGYSYARRKYDNARRSSRTKRSPILPIRHYPPNRSGLLPAIHSKVKEEDREGSSETVVSQEEQVAANVTEPGTLKRKSREFDVETMTKVSRGVNTDEPPRKRSRTPPAEATHTRQSVEDRVDNTVDEHVQGSASPAEESAVASEDPADVPMEESPREADEDTEANSDVPQPAAMPLPVEFSSKPPSTPASPLLRTKPLPESDSSTPTPPSEGNAQSSATVAEDASSTSSGSPPAFAFATSAFASYASMTSSPFNATPRPAFAQLPSTSNGFSKYSATKEPFKAFSNGSSPFKDPSRTSAATSIFTSSPFKTTTSVFGTSASVSSSPFGTFASTSSAFSHVYKEASPEPSRDGSPSAEEGEAGAGTPENEPAEDHVLSVAASYGAAPVPVITGEESEEVKCGISDMALWIGRGPDAKTVKWSRKLTVHAKLLKDEATGAERVVCREKDIGVVRLNVALRPGIACLVGGDTTIESLTIYAPDHNTHEIVRYLMKKGSADQGKFGEFVAAVRQSDRLPTMTHEEIERIPRELRRGEGEAETPGTQDSA